MNAAHTPGPWQVRGTTIEAPVDPENSRTYIAPICTVDEEWRDWKHNARLIAAAPQLLESNAFLAKALRDLLDATNGIVGRVAPGGAWVEQAQAAIKANDAALRAAVGAL